MTPIWQFPNFCLKVIRLDWLHVVDLGCAQDAAGNMLLMLQSKMPGNNMTARIGELYKQILQEYSNQAVSQDRLTTLTETMIRKNASSAPRLKAKGAETRKLIPVLAVLCYKLQAFGHDEGSRASSWNVTKHWISSQCCSTVLVGLPCSIQA